MFETTVRSIYSCRKLTTNSIFQEAENQYRLEGAGLAAESEVLDKLNAAKIATPDPEKLPVPSREYLALHATCAKVVFSRAGEHADSGLRKMEETLVLSSNGSSTAILEHAIWAAQCNLVSV